MRIKKPFIISIILTCILLFAFQFFFLIVFQKINKSNFKTQVLLKQSSLLVKKVISNKELLEPNSTIYFEDEGKEIVINGQFYEVIHTKKHNGLTTLYLLPDFLESKLFSVFNKQDPYHPNYLLHLLKTLLSNNYLASQFISFLPGSATNIYFSDNKLNISLDKVFNLIKPPQY